MALLSLFYYASIGLALASLTVAPHHRGRDRSSASSCVTSIMLAAVDHAASPDATLGVTTGSAAAPPRPAASLPLVLRDLVFLGHVDPEFALSGVHNGGLAAVVVYSRRGRRRRRRRSSIRYDEVER